MNPDVKSELLQSLISASSGLAALYPLQGTNSKQLSARGSVPTMQTRLSADAIDRTGVFGLDTIQKSHLSDASQAHQLNALLSFQGSAGIHGQSTKLEAERLVRQQNLGFAANPSGQVSPFNDPAVLAFKKPGQQEIYQMGSTSERTSTDQLGTLRENNSNPSMSDSSI